MALTKSERAALREMFGGLCAYCGILLPEKGWHADHINAIIRQTKMTYDRENSRYKVQQTGKCYRPENERKDGYYPACAKCNIEKATGTIEDFRAGLMYKIEVLRKNSANWNHLERFGIVAVVKSEVVFHFESAAPPTSKGRDD